MDTPPALPSQLNDRVGAVDERLGPNVWLCAHAVAVVVPSDRSFDAALAAATAWEKDGIGPKVLTALAPWIITERPAGSPAHRPEVHREIAGLAELAAHALARLHAVRVPDEVRHVDIAQLVAAARTDTRNFPEPYRRYDGVTLRSMWAEQQATPSAPAVLVHGCARLSYIFVDNGRVTGVVNPAFVMAGDPHIDYATCHRSISEKLGNDAVFRFHEVVDAPVSLVAMEQYLLAELLLYGAPGERRPPLVIVGPTASGKSDVAIRLATEVGNCEIVSADAMAVYRRMDIGTAKIPEAERGGIVHHGIDIVEPSQEFTVSVFASTVHNVICDIEARGKSVILVGGTGLYVRAVVDAFSIPGQFPDVVADLEQIEDTESLWQRLAALDPHAATKMEPSNRRRILRALEVTIGSGQPFSSFGPGVDAYPATRFCQVGLDIDRAIMDERINQRYEHQMQTGFLDEVKQLRNEPAGLSKTAAQALGYRELLAHLDGDMSLDEALEEAKARTRRFARKQQRWFRRDPRIQWIQHDASDLVDRCAALWQEFGANQPN